MHSSVDQARQEVLSYINSGMKNDLFIDNENTYQATYLGSPLPNNDKDKPEGGMPSKIVDGIYDTTDNKLTGVGISFVLFSTLGVFSIILLLIRKRKQRRYLATMEKLDDDSFTDEEKRDDENDLKDLSFTSSMDEDNKYKNVADEQHQMILNNVTSLTQDSEEESMMTRPVSILSEPSNDEVFHHLPSSPKNSSFLNSSPNSYRKPSMMKSKNSITFSKKEDGSNAVRKVEDDNNPLFVSVNSPPFRGSYGKRGGSNMAVDNRRDYRANDSVVL